MNREEKLEKAMRKVLELVKEGEELARRNPYALGNSVSLGQIEWVLSEALRRKGG